MLATGDGQIRRAQVIPDVLQLRLQHFKKSNDAAGCRATAEMWEKLNRDDAESLYTAGRMRAVSAAVIRARDYSEETAKESAAEADRAMAWLKQAVAAGYDNGAHARTLMGSPAAQQHHDGAGYNNAQMSEDEDLDALRDREDFKKLLAEVTEVPKS